jgi:hypothetical protein
MLFSATMAPEIEDLAKGLLKEPTKVEAAPQGSTVVKIDQRVITFALATQETVTRDGVAVKINAVLWFRAVDAAKVVTTVENWTSAVIQAAETGLRDAIGQSELDLILKDRTSINKRLLELLDTTVRQWGVTVDAVEIKDLDIPEQMQRAIAREAEAIREKRARIIKAEGEFEASQKLAQAARTIGEVPGALELRRLQTLSEIGVEHNSTIVAMFPTELLEAAQRLGRGIAMAQQDGRLPELPLLPPFRLDECGWVANRWAELLPLPVVYKQALLQESDPLARLRAIDRSMDREDKG